MAKDKPEHTTPPSPTAERPDSGPQIAWRQWVAMTSANMSDIKDRIGGWDFFCNVMERHLQDGSIRAVARRVVEDRQTDLPDRVWRNVSDRIAPRVTQNGRIVERELRASFWQQRPSGNSVRILHLSNGTLLVEFITHDGKRYAIQGRRFLDSFGYQIFLERAAVEHLAGAVAPMAKAIESHKPLPTIRPDGVGPKGWRAAQAVVEIVRDDGGWSDLDSLLNKVRDRIGNSRLSKRTLNGAIRYLRIERIISR